VYVPNITVSLPDEVYRRVRIRAAEENTSVSGLVRRLVLEIGTKETEFERRKRLQDEVLASIGRFSARTRLTRDEVHERDIR
jgi:plasmid stability protein